MYLDGDTFFAVDGDAKVIICAFADVFDVPEGIAELFGQGGGEGGHDVGDGAVFLGCHSCKFLW